ncbi:hypothetical protein SAMN02745866_01749 [Alteromonadaceae bacterium Bs31]|nr:hypothetical protein SAMN02745866_01749 [Alteromonadaceae bacterium Bs31]
MPGRFTSAEVTELTREIKEYLCVHRNVADTLEGWVTRWRVNHGECVELARMELVMEQLCREKILKKRILHGGTTLYVPAQIISERNQD